MKRILTLTLFVCLGSANGAMATLEGSWTASTSTARPGRIQLNLTT